MSAHRDPAGDDPDGLCAGDLAMSRVFLDFPPATQTRFERDTKPERVVHLRRSIAVGLLFYNAYNLSDFLLIPDVALYSSALRLLVLTPIALLLMWLVPRLSARLREALVTVAMVGVSFVPAAALGVSHSPLVGYTVAEMPLVLVYGGMMLVLSVAHTTVFSLITLAFTVIAIRAQPMFAGTLGAAMIMQTITACAFVLYGNRQIESVRRQAFLTALREVLRSDRLEKAQNRFAAMSETDALTGLANRRALDALLQRDARVGELGLLMLDIDFFKPFNDTYGHLAGDDCLRAVATALALSVRPQDRVARYGGEEFVIVVQDASEADLDAMSERISKRLQWLPIRHDARPDGKTWLTVSTGIAFGAEPGAALLAAADQALYRAKREGRDRRCFAGDGDRLAA